MNTIQKFSLKKISIGLLILLISLIVWENKRLNKTQNMVGFAKANGASIMMSKPDWVKKLPESFAHYYPENVESIYFREDVSKILIKVLNDNLKSTSIFKHWDKAEVDSLVSNNKPVLVHFTPVWGMPINRITIQKAGTFLKSHNINVYIATFSNDTSEMLSFMKKHNSYSLLTVFFWNGKAYKMPETYTDNSLQEKLKRIMSSGEQ